MSVLGRLSYLFGKAEGVGLCSESEPDGICSGDLEG